MSHGTVLAGRYRLDDRVETTPDGALWHATDKTLERGVAVRVLNPHHPYAADAADAARRAALIEDPRMVRVLDVSVQDGHPFVVTEQINGTSLAELVARRRLDAVLARRVVGEVAQALERAGERGLHHLRLSPHRVVIRADGSVKLLGTAVDAAAAGMEPYPPKIANRVDAVELVALLYFALTRRWPIADPGGPGRVPTISTDVPAPGGLVDGVPDELDRLCVDTLGPHDDGPRDPSELVLRLTPWSPAVPLAATAPAVQASRPDRPPPAPAGMHAAAPDATQVMPTVPSISDPRPAPLPNQIQSRPAEPSPAVSGAAAKVTGRRAGRRDDPEAALGTLLPVDQGAAAAAPAATPPPAYARSTSPPSPDPARPGRVHPGGPDLRRSRPPVERPPVPPGGDGDVNAWWTRPASNPDRSDAGSFPPLEPQPQAPPRHQTRWVILGVAGLVALVLLFAVYSLRDFGDSSSGLLQGDPTFSTPGGATSAAAATPVPSAPTSTAATATEKQVAAPSIEAIEAIDPQGDGDENDGDAPTAIDGRDGTSWRTNYYSSRAFGGLKDGVGLVLDLGRRSTTREVRLEFAGNGGRVELRTANRSAFRGSDVAASANLNSSPVTLQPSEPAEARYLVLWFTRLTRVDGENRIDLAEITVK